jgi:hypothetical protein
VSRRRNPQTDTPAFRRWFGDSKVVDPKGNPLVVYHGSPKRFDTFVRPDIAAILKDGYADEDEQNQGMGIYFTDSAENAATYGREVYPVYLRMLNPLIVDAQGENWSYVPFKGSFYYADDIVSVAEGKGHDGVVFLNIYDSKSANGILSNTYIVFDPKQIKSATGNRGTFDPDDPSILRNPRETVADRIKRFERYEVRTEESKDYPLFGRGFLALAAQRYSEDEYVRLVAAALELDGRWGLLAEPSAYPPPKGVLLKALKERYAAERTKPVTIEVRFRDMWEATAYVGEGRYDRTEVGFVVAAPDYPLACPEEYATLRKAHGDAPSAPTPYCTSGDTVIVRRRPFAFTTYQSADCC